MTKGQPEPYFLLHMAISLIIRIISNAESARQDDTGCVRVHKKKNIRFRRALIRHYSLC